MRTMKFEPDWKKARRWWATRGVAVAVSAGVHVIIGAALIWSPDSPAPAYALDPIAVDMVQPEPQPPPIEAPPKPNKEPPAKKAIVKPKPEKAAKPKIAARPAPPSRVVPPVVAGQASTGLAMAEVSDSDLHGAATAGSGSGEGGGQCNMVRLLQDALRTDAKVQASAARVHRGKAILVWNGAWVRSPDEEGAGLANVRETMMVKIAFAPEACRRQQMRGLVLISLNDTPGSARLALGDASWRWTDLTLGRN